jgi:protein O-mannosyl-transferase
VSKKQKILAILPFLAAFLAFLPVLNNGFVYDDILIFHSELPHFSTLAQSWIHPQVLTYMTSAYYRPLIYFIFQITRSLSGYEPWGYHLVLLCLHSLTALLIYFTSYEFLKERKHAVLGAATSAIFFAVHPIHVEVVSWASATVEASMSFFFILSLYLFILFRQNAQKRYYFFSALSFLCALFSKETAAMLIILLPLYDYFFIKTSLSKKHNKRHYLLYTICFALYYALRHLNLPSNPLSSINVGFGEGSLRLISAMGYYLQNSIWPITVNPYIASVQTTSKALIGSLIFISIFSFLTLYTFKKFKAISYHLCLFFLTIGPALLVSCTLTSSLPLSERYLYLPSYGICFALGALMTLEVKPLIQNLKISLLVFLVIIGGYYSFQRSKIWHDEFSFWSQAIKVNPDYMAPWANLGTAFVHKNNCPKALAYFEKALPLKETNDNGISKAGLYLNKALCHHLAGQREKAKTWYLKSNEVSMSPKASFNLGMLYLDEAKINSNNANQLHQKANAVFKDAYKLDSTNVKYGYHLAKTYDLLGEAIEAKQYYNITLSLSGNDEWIKLAKEALENME